MKMKRGMFLVFVLLIALSCKDKAKKEVAEEPIGIENVAYKWGEMALEATAVDTERFKPRPTIT